LFVMLTLVLPRPDIVARGQSRISAPHRNMDYAGPVGIVKGAIAGAIGTAAMTAAQAAEMGTTGRPASMVPGQVASKLLRLDPDGEEEMARISLAMHWAHGMTQGVVRSLVGRTGLEGTAAAAVHFALMWSSDAMLYKALDISPWPWEWSADELAPDVGHKAFYALVTSAAYDRLS